MKQNRQRLAEQFLLEHHLPAQPRPRPSCTHLLAPRLLPGVPGLPGLNWKESRWWYLGGSGFLLSLVHASRGCVAQHSASLCVTCCHAPLRLHSVGSKVLTTDEHLSYVLLARAFVLNGNMSSV